MSDDLHEAISDVEGATDAETSRRSGGRLAPFIALGIALALIGLVVLFVGADPDAERTPAQSSLLGRPAPEAVGELGDGTPFDLSRRKGSWVVLNFFQSSCVPCIAEHPELVEFVEQQEQLGLQGAEFYSVVFGDSKENVEEFFEREGGDWPVIYPTDDLISVAFGVNLVPETWLIDPQGVVQRRFQGEVTAELLSVTIQQVREGA
ncbi:MAG: TlpA disulfide reductase family protein [Ilumatobacter sp.]|uniref:TlpA family protein disulfide reductase n=1 Tax=Ilumatobacter sp. TaxID=1967498 RepID=UPI003C7535A8